MYLRIKVARDFSPDKRRRTLPAERRSRIFHNGPWRYLVPYGSLHHIDGEPKECTILDGFQLHGRLIKETIGKHLHRQCGAKTAVKQNKSVVHIPVKEALDVLEGKSGIVVQLLGVSGPLSKKFGLEIFMGERRTTVNLVQYCNCSCQIFRNFGNQLRARTCQLGRILYRVLVLILLVIM